MDSDEAAVSGSADSRAVPVSSLLHEAIKQANNASGKMGRCIGLILVICVLRNFGQGPVNSPAGAGLELSDTV
jgi:hypothetical protein